MNIPNYWAAHTLECPYKNKTTKIKRYGWSNDSQPDAKEHAMERCQQAYQTLLETGKVKRIERKDLYPDESGLPIREEIVTEYSDLNCVTTINGYGATCLNTPNVMILDVDHDDLLPRYLQSTRDSQPTQISELWVALIFVVLIIYINLIDIQLEPMLQIFIFGTLFGFVVMLINFINDKRYLKWLTRQGGLTGMLDSFIMPFLAKYPEMAFNIYETPLGFRLIAINNTYLPSDSRVQHCFDELPVDKRYARLCQVQHCFRARVTAKPWNVGIDEPRIPIKDFWLEESKLKNRKAWLKEYHELAQAYSASQFIKRVGQAQIHPQVAKVVDLHDELCRSHSKLPVA